LRKYYIQQTSLFYYICSINNDFNTPVICNQP